MRTPIPLSPWTALTIKQPWAWLICCGPKDIENRTWSYLPEFRHEFLIHASKSLDQKALELFRAHEPKLRKRFGMPALPKTFDLGGFVGVARLSGSFGKDAKLESPWAEPVACRMFLADRRPIPFVPFKGSLSFWPVPVVAMDALRQAGASLPERPCAA